MTTLTRFSGMNELLTRLDAVRLRHWVICLVTGLLAIKAVAVGSLLVITALLGYWPNQPPAVLRWGLVLAAVGGGLFVLLRVLLTGTLRALRQNPAQVARFIEQSLPEARNDLINSILLARDGQQASAELVQAAIHEAQRRSRRVDLFKSVSLLAMKRWAIAAGGAVVLLAAFIMLQPQRFNRGLAALNPVRYVPGVNSLELIRLLPGDTKLFAGERLTISAEVRNARADVLDAQLILRDQGAPLDMDAGRGFSVFTREFAAVEQTFEYAVRIGESRWPVDKPYYTVTVVRRVQVEGLDIEYVYPKYLGKENLPVRDSDGSIEAPVGTTARVTLRLAEPAPAVMLEIQGQGLQKMTLRPGSDRAYEAAVPVNADGFYRIQISDSAGSMIQQLPDVSSSATPAGTYSAADRARMQGYYRIQAQGDTPPRIEFTRPNRDLSVPLGGKLTTTIKVFDQYGLTGASFHAGKEGGDIRPVHSYNLGGKSEGTFDYELVIDDQWHEGDVIVYYATATDNRMLEMGEMGRQRLGPQTSASARFKVTVQDPAKVAAEKARRFDELRNRLLAILRVQEAAKVNNLVCAQRHGEALDKQAAGQDVAAAIAELKTTGAEILGEQKKVKADLLDLAEHFPFDPEMIQMQQVIALLATNEAAVAILQAQVVIEVLAASEKQPRSFDLLAETQDQVIDRLRMLLAIMPSLANKAAKATSTASGNDLPPEVRDKLADLKDKIEELMDEQRKVIEASKRLAKKPVDNFSPEDEKLLKDLIATQDKWEKFLNEAFSDFSKLLQQDMSNPSIMKELISVKSDITMAKDALKKKAEEIATAIEDNGVMENAKSLTSNIEKWLPDKPDRTKWDMEDPTDDMEQKVEAPELPTELEDLVGDLLEEEEDLFDEMQDLTGKYMTSGDKGIGWDAMDGPISSMNAQGVTGNQLPNPNELQGRSGEGRQGKSSGEFVEDKAVGKGGRRTPTRLTPEPFQKGQVDDQSKEPAGGATGGGKLSGAGEEGLEGPVPPPITKEMPRLAGKQASLVNKAEKLQEKFQQDTYSGFKLNEAIILMNRVQNDLANFRYQNVLRSRDQMLKDLQETKLNIGTQVDVQTDTSNNMPKYVRDDIADAMKGKMPEEFREVMEQYYKQLSERAGR